VAVAKPKPPRRKLSFNEQHALKNLPGEIASLETEIAQLLRRLGDPGLYSRDPLGFGRASEALAEKQSALTAAEERWLELEIGGEAIEGDGACLQGATRFRPARRAAGLRGPRHGRRHCAAPLSPRGRRARQSSPPARFAPRATWPCGQNVPRRTGRAARRCIRGSTP